MVAVVVLLALGAATAYVLTGAGGGTAARASVGVVTIADADLESVRVEFASGEPVEVRRGSLADLWLLSEGGRVYPAHSARLRAMLRVLGEARVTPGGDLSKEGVAATVRLRRRTGGEAVIRLVGEPLGGRGGVIVEIDEAAVSMQAPSGVHQMFRRAGLLAWRSSAVFPAGTAGVSRLGVRSGEGGVALARSAGQWGLIEPVSAPADAAAVAAVLAGLDRAILTRFIEEGAEGEGARVSAESEVRELEGEVVKRRVLVQSVSFLGRGVEGVFTVRLEGALREADGSVAPLWEAVAEVRGEGLSGLSTRAEGYLSPVSFGGSAADVGWVGFGEEGKAAWFRRELESWQRGEGGGAGAPASEDDARRVRQVIEMLCVARADRMASALGFEAAVEVWLGRAEGEPLARFEVGLIAGGDGRAVAAVRAGEVVRLYGHPSAVEVVEWLARQR